MFQNITQNFDYITVFTKIKDKEHYIYYLIELNTVINQTQIEEIINSNPNEILINHNEIELLKSNLENSQKYIIYGNKMNMKSTFYSNSQNIFQKCDIKNINRIERFHIVKKEHFNIETLDLMTMKTYDKLPQYFKNYSINDVSLYPKVLNIKDISVFNKNENLGFDAQDIQNYESYFSMLGRAPTNMELLDLSQSNSEHSRHWFFNGKMEIVEFDKENNEYKRPYINCKSLFDYVKRPLKHNNTGSIIAFKDNSSVIEGYDINYLYPEPNTNLHNYKSKNCIFDILLTAETHNFPTGIAPFEGATTGTGGRLRDVLATGRGGLMIAGTAGYCVGNLLLDDYELDYEENISDRLDVKLKGWKILIEASNGASDYGNKIGEPLILGFTRSYGQTMLCEYNNEITQNEERIEWIKPIMFSGGIGSIYKNHTTKKTPKPNMLIVRAGGPAYRIGLGGGAASSTEQNNNDSNAMNDYHNAVQRGNAEMENRLYKFLRSCIENFDNNPILVIHDQGAGGPANVTKEIVEPCGGIVDLNNLNLGDNTLSSIEKWISEFQESVTFLVNVKDIKRIKEIAKRESVDLEFFGFTTNSGKIEVIDTAKDTLQNNIDVSKSVVYKRPENLLELGVHEINNISRKKYKLIEKKCNILEPLSKYINIEEDAKHLEKLIKKVFSLVSVGSKRFLVNKVDRSVSGLIVQQQTCGYNQLPVSDYGLTLLSSQDKCGIATSIGEQPIKSLLNIENMVVLTVGEMLTNLMFVKIRSFEDIKCSGNWMMAPKIENEGYLLFKAAKKLSNILIELGIAIDGGKDSLSMCSKGFNDEYIKSPRTLVMSSYVGVDNVDYRLTPDLKKIGNKLLYINLGNNNNRISGSALLNVYNLIGCNDDVPNIDNLNHLYQIKDVFQLIQKYIQNIYSKNKIIYSGHDRSDGGLITTVLEMAFSGNKAVRLDLDISKEHIIDYLFNEELGIVLEVDAEKYETLVKKLNDIIQVSIIGTVIEGENIIININKNPENDTQNDTQNETLLNYSMHELHEYWEKTSYYLDKKQTNIDCVYQEYNNLYNRKELNYRSSIYNEYLNNNILYNYEKYNSYNNFDYLYLKSKKVVGIIREEGSNGEKEMASCFYNAGFKVLDITTNDLLTNPYIIRDLDIIAFVGGFTYSDTFGSASGWYNVLKSNNILYQELINFRNDKTKYALGICNGFQLLTLLGWFDDIETEINTQLIQQQITPQQIKLKIRLTQNNSQRFESRFNNIKVYKNNSVFLHNMEDNVLGVWSSHGEGKISFYDSNTNTSLENNNTVMNIIEKYVPFKYIDDNENNTILYPYNPNGSYSGFASLSSKDGRILGMMPHAERSLLKNNWAYIPVNLFNNNSKYSPWFIMFLNVH